MAFSFPLHLPMVIPSTLAPLSIRLDRLNHAFWRSQILPTVRAHDLEGFLLGTRLKPTEFLSYSTTCHDPIRNPDYLTWMRLDQFLMSWLLSSINEQMLGHVFQCNTSTEIWKVLDQLFSTRSRAQILQLRGSLQTTRKGTESVEEYILKMKGISHALMAAGQHVSDDELILYILGGLGSDCESVVVNLTSRDSVTLQEVQYLLQTHEMRLEHLTTASVVEFPNSEGFFLINNEVLLIFEVIKQTLEDALAVEVGFVLPLEAATISFQERAVSFCVRFVVNLDTLL